MAEFTNQDDSKMEDLNLQVGSNPELDDGVAQEPQVQDSEDSTPIVSAEPASCSAINEANKKTDSSPSRNDESSETSEVNREAEEDDGNDGDGEHEPESDEETSSLVTQPPDETVGLCSFGTQPWNPHRFDSDTSPLMVPPGENVGFSSLVTQSSHQNPRLDQNGRSGQTMNPHQQPTRPYSGSPLDASYQNSYRQPLGMQQQLFSSPPVSIPQNTYQQHPMPYQIPNVVPMQTHMFNGGPAFAPWIPQNTYQQPPVPNQIPNVVPAQIFIRGPAPAPWRLENTYQQQPVAYQIPNVVPVPMQTHMFNRGPASAPWRPENTYQQHPVANQIPNVVLMQTQMFNRGPVSAPWRLQNTYQQHPVANQFPMNTYQQHPEIEQRYISCGMRPMQDPVTFPYQPPEANHLFATISPDGQPRTVAVLHDYYNPQLREYMFLDTAIVYTPQAEVDHLLQLHNQRQQSTQSQGVDGGASSEQGGHQQQP